MSKLRRRSDSVIQAACLVWVGIGSWRTGFPCFVIVRVPVIAQVKIIGTTNHLERDLEEVRRRIKIQGYFKNERSVYLWTYGIISQFRIDENRADEPKYIFTIVKEPFVDSRFRGNYKHESVQYS